MIDTSNAVKPTTAQANYIRYVLANQQSTARGLHSFTIIGATLVLAGLAYLLWMIWDYADWYVILGLMPFIIGAVVVIYAALDFKPSPVSYDAAGVRVLSVVARFSIEHEQNGRYWYKVLCMNSNMGSHTCEITPRLLKRSQIEKTSTPVKAIIVPYPTTNPVRWKHRDCLVIALNGVNGWE